MISSLFQRHLSIRNAVPNDLQFFNKLVGQLNLIVTGKKELPKEFQDGYVTMLNDPMHYSLFVAEDKDTDNKIIKRGVAITTKQIFLLTGQPYLYLQELIVDEESRGKGVGSALVKHIFDYCKDHQINYIDLVQPSDSDPHHEKRTKFYSKFGFQMGGRHRHFLFDE